MSANDASRIGTSRRKMLGTIASAGALLGLGSATGRAATAGAPAADPASGAPEDLFALARLRNYKNLRSGSWDRTGGNADWAVVEPGKTATLLDVQGRGRRHAHLVHHQFAGSDAPEESGAARVVG